MNKSSQNNIIFVDEYKNFPKWKRWLYETYDFLFELILTPIYNFYCDWIRIRTWINRIRYFFQRRFRGFDDTETWSLDYTLYKWLLPRLIRFKELNIGWPDSQYKTFEDWNNELQDRIDQLKLIVEDEGMSDLIDEDEIQDFNNWLSNNINHLWW